MAEHDPEFEPPELPELLSLGLIVGGRTLANELVREAFGAHALQDDEAALDINGWSPDPCHR